MDSLNPNKYRDLGCFFIVHFVVVGLLVVGVDLQFTPFLAWEL